MDYIIIGGGAAGCLLAERLSKDPLQQVTLLEAGGQNQHPLVKIPAGIIGLMRSQKFNWSLRTQPQSQLDNRCLFWPRGKGLGGSTAINAMCYTRGQAEDFDDWQKHGVNGWDYQNLLPHFKKMEAYHQGENTWHGTDGELQVQALRHKHTLSHAFVAACQEYGLPLNEDFNSAQQLGTGFYDVMQNRGQRCSAAHAFLNDAKARPNLTIISHAQVEKIQLQDKRAIGVLYHKQGKSHFLKADKEVLLSAGAIHSPQILMLSGIGPKAELIRHGIHVEHQLEGVGQNLQDHLDISLIHLDQSKSSISFHPSFLPAGLKALSQYPKRRGLLTSNIAEAGAFVATEEDNLRPDVQLHFLPAVEVDHGLNLWPTTMHYGYTLRACLLRPESRGHICLQSRSPFDAPLIDPNYLSAEEDMNGMLRAFDCANDILQQTSLKTFSKQAWLPEQQTLSNAQKMDYIRQHAESIYHPVGTCKMGTDSMSVVDETLKVIGIDNLRVIDAAIMPTLVSGNTTAATLAIASKAVDSIQAKHNTTTLNT